jgi:DNA-binding PadR family transcriptional regulator
LSTGHLTLFSFEILGLVGRDGAGPHDLLRMARQGRVLAWAGESQYYTEPKRLASLGYLAARTEPGKTRARTVYTLTERGREALAEYARTPVRITPIKSDALVRLLICDLVGEPVTRDALRSLREDIDDVRARLVESERRAEALPHREKYLRLTLDHLHGLVDLHEQLVSRAEHELGS